MIARTPKAPRYVPHQGIFNLFCSYPLDELNGDAEPSEAFLRLFRRTDRATGGQAWLYVEAASEAKMELLEEDGWQDYIERTLEDACGTW